MVVSVTIGMSSPKSRHESADDLLRSADVAMYTVKSNGKNGYAMFEPQMHQAVVTRLSLRSDLQSAIDRGDIVSFYQPLVSLHTGGVVGFEALARWKHADRGLVSPAEFIPLAEESGLILPLGQVILENACQQAQEWQQRYPSGVWQRDGAGARLPSVKMSVNLSARQLQHDLLVRDVEAVLARTKLPPQSLVLEITLRAS